MQHCNRVALVICRTTIVISVPPVTHLPLSDVKHLKVKCLSKNTTSKQRCPSVERGKHGNSLKIVHQLMIEFARQAAEITSKAPCSNHCTSVLSIKRPSLLYHIYDTIRKYCRTYTGHAIDSIIILKLTGIKLRLQSCVGASAIVRGNNTPRKQCYRF